MLTTCLTCANAALRDRDNPERDKSLRAMAASAMVNCLVSEFRASFYPLKHTCPKWEPTLPEVTKAREAWAQREFA